MTIQYPPDDQVHFFSSHSWAHGQHRDALHRLLRPWTKGVDFRDLSVTARHPLNTETDPELAYELSDIIRGVDTLLIMAGMYANNSSWMQFEVNAAFVQRVPIIPILANGQERVPRLPTRLASCAPVRWRGDSIREAILSFLPAHRRQAVEAKVARRVAADAASLRARAAPQPAYNGPVFLPQTKTLPALPPRRNVLADLIDSPPTNYLSGFIRRP